jgi:hypothetical protein
MPAQLEGHALALLDLDQGRGARAGDLEPGRRAQGDRIGAGGEARAVALARDPRVARAVAEAHVEQHLDLDVTVQALEDAHHLAAVAIGDRHEVGDAHAAALALEVGLEDERVAAVALLDVVHRDGRAEGPAAVLVVAEQRREARVGVEARHAQPVDVGGARDERAGAEVADESVVLDLGGHAATVGAP